MKALSEMTKQELSAYKSHLEDFLLDLLSETREVKRILKEIEGVKEHG